MNNNTPDTEWEKEFDEKFNKAFCCDHDHYGEECGKEFATKCKSFIKKTLTSRDTYWKEEMKKARQDWLRSEIEKLEGMKQPITIDDRVESAFASIEWDRYNEALTTIITRYKEELKVLESKV